MKVLISFILLAVTQARSENQGATEVGDGTSMKYSFAERNDGSSSDLEDSGIQTRAQASDVTYYFFSSSDPAQGTDVSDVAALANTDFSPLKDTVFLIHGFEGDRNDEFSESTKETLLDVFDLNVVVVDWSPVANQDYLNARNGILPVGVFVASFINTLVSTYGLQLSKVICAGHSLGAHICGNAGAALNGQVGKIFAFDAAGPLITASDINGRLDTTDAIFVVGIHTNGGVLGMLERYGHVDYYPNGGITQPGCGIDVGCSHGRSYKYFGESNRPINNKSFKSVLCSSYTIFTLGLCSSNTVSIMGSLYTDTGLRGKFYLTTNSNSPYARG